MTTKAIAVLSPDGKTVTHTHAGTGPKWGNKFPVENLDAQIAFYRRLRDRVGGKYSRFYESDVAALEAVKARVEARARAAG